MAHNRHIRVAPTFPTRKPDYRAMKQFAMIFRTERELTPVCVALLE
jgi:hypothetical protein